MVSMGCRHGAPVKTHSASNTKIITKLRNNNSRQFIFKKERAAGKKNQEAVCIYVVGDL